MNAQSENSITWFNALEPNHFEELKLDFACEIEAAAERSGIKRKEIAERMGTSPAWVSKVLRGDANPTLETMQRLAETLDCKVYLHVAPAHAVGVWSEICISPAQVASVNVQPMLTHETPFAFTLQLGGSNVGYRSVTKEVSLHSQTKNYFVGAL